MNFDGVKILIYLGGVITTWVINRVLDAIPNYLGYRIRYNYKALIKWVNNNKIKVCFSYKITEPPLILEEYKNKIKDIFLKETFEFTGEKGNNLMFKIKFSNLDLEITIIPSYHPEQEVIKVDALELNILMNTNFRSFKDDVNDIYKFKDDIYEIIMQSKYDIPKNLSTTFYLGGMYKLTGILKEELIKVKQIITYYY